MAQEKFLPSDKEFKVGMYQIIDEAIIIRQNYEIVRDYQLHELAATISTDLINLVFGWDGNPTVSGREIKPFRLRENGK